MDYSLAYRPTESPSVLVDQRAAPRFVSMIRSAKLVTGDGEFVCVIRDVSSVGVKLRCYHAIPPLGGCLLELQSGQSYLVEWVRTDGMEASFTFADSVDVENLIHESWNHPRRQLRLSLEVPVTVVTLAGRFEARTINLSQQGARIECAAPLAIDQALRLESECLPDIRAKVRWHTGRACGLVFDDTFSLNSFAQLAAAIQKPELLECVS